MSSIFCSDEMERGVSECYIKAYFYYIIQKMYYLRTYAIHYL